MDRSVAKTRKKLDHEHRSSLRGWRRVYAPTLSSGADGDEGREEDAEGGGGGEGRELLSSALDDAASSSTILEGQVLVRE